MGKKTKILFISIGIAYIGSYVYFSLSHRETPTTYITQSAPSDNTESCLSSADFPTILGADKTPLTFIPATDTYTLLAFCSPLAQGCTDLINNKKMVDISQRQEHDICNFHTLIPYSQRSSWLKTTITLQPYFAIHSAGVEVTSRENINTVLQLTNDVVPLFVLLDSCGKIIAKTSDSNEIIPLFSPYCGAITHPVCGNGILEDKEICDDGNIEENDACTALCQPTTCGDEIINIPNTDGQIEQCDDGNTTDDDGCSAICQLEKEHIWYCDADGDSFFSFTSLPIDSTLFPHVVVQKGNEEKFVYCTKDLGCKYVPCRHEHGDDCNDANDQEYTIGSYCAGAAGGVPGIFDESCDCSNGSQGNTTFTTQSVDVTTKRTTQAQGWCGSPDGKFINYPGSKEGGDSSATIRYQCSINNCSYCTDEVCFPKGGVCYYFCQEGDTEDYTAPCGNGLASDIQTLNACASNATCGKHN